MAVGWFSENMPRRLKRGESKPVYLWDTLRGFDMELVYIPPGEFTMGSGEGTSDENGPAHVHPISAGYYIGRTEVTVAQFGAFVTATAYVTDSERLGFSWTTKWVDDDPRAVKGDGLIWRRPGFQQQSNHPVVCVSWEDARAFCRWVSLELPSESRWEKAARGTDGRAYPWGNDWRPELLNSCDSAYWGSLPDKATVSDGFPRTAPIGSYPLGASPFGAYDMAGNVSELCADWSDPRAYKRYACGSYDPPGPGVHGITYRVFRGGSFSSRRLESWRRGGLWPTWSADHIGFRVALQLGLQEPD